MGRVPSYSDIVKEEWLKTTEMRRPYDIKYNYFPINLDSSIMFVGRLGGLTEEEWEAAEPLSW